MIGDRLVYVFKIYIVRNAHMNISITTFYYQMSALGLGKKEDEESPWDSEVLSFIIILNISIE